MKSNNVISLLLGIGVGLAIGLGTSNIPVGVAAGIGTFLLFNRVYAYRHKGDSSTEP